MIWRFVGRFTGNALGAMGSSAGAKQILPQESLRRAVIMLNVGAGTVRITDKASKPINIADDGFPIIQNMLLSPAVAPFGPTNEIWGTGEAGYDLYVMEMLVGQNVRKQS